MLGKQKNKKLLKNDSVRNCMTLKTIIGSTKQKAHKFLSTQWLVLRRLGFTQVKFCKTSFADFFVVAKAIATSSVLLILKQSSLMFVR